MEEPPARTALLEAAARGRRVPTTLQVRPGLASGAPMAPELAAAFEGLHVEEVQLCTDADAASTSSDAASQAWLPVRLVKRARAQQERLPAVVLLHATGASKDSMATQQAEFARRGYLAVAVDCRYHGERSVDLEDCRGGYEQALVRAWRRSGERPFLLDNVWDLHRLLDWLQHRPDVDAARIGMTGVSLGGMHTWLTAAADVRVAVAAPMIGVQHFGWAVQQQQYHGRVGSIPLVFQAAAADLAQQQQQGTAAGAEVSPEVVAAVWEQLLPGLLDRYDAPHSLPLLAPRPLLVANGEVDPRCPMQGVEVAMEAVRAAYERHGAADKLQLYVVPGCGHECTACMWEQVFAFMDRHLRGTTPCSSQHQAAEAG